MCVRDADAALGSVEVVGQPEAGEPGRGVEERRDARDPAIAIDPLARTGTQRDPRQSLPGPVNQRTISCGPWTHRVYGGMLSTASSCSRPTSVSMSYRSNASRYLARSSWSMLSAGVLPVFSIVGALVPSVARARCSALLTDATEVSRR